MANSKVQVHIRVPHDLYEQIKNIASDENWNINFFINEAIKNYVKLKS